MNTKLSTKEKAHQHKPSLASSRVPSPGPSPLGASVHGQAECLHPPVDPQLNEPVREVSNICQTTLGKQVSYPTLV